MQELDDTALLREYVERGSEEAFAALVTRHVNKVYSVALRHTGNPHSAEEITQAVFVILAKKSRHLGKRVILSGWLYQTARLTAVTFIRGGIRRARREQRDFLGDAAWAKKDIIGVPWLAADDLDLPDPQLGNKTELYDFTAVAYESVMLGMFMIHRGPHNDVCKELKILKITELSVGFSRDGVNWLRPGRRAFIGCSRKPGTWNRAYVHPTGGVCLVVGDQLYFYFGAWSGISPKLGGNLEAGGSTGLAVLRRDGLVSLDTGARGGTLTTPRVVFSG